MVENILMKRTKTAAYNGRFGATAAVCPQKRQCEIERLSPAETVVEAAAAPSRWDVVCNVRTTQWQVKT